MAPNTKKAHRHHQTHYAVFAALVYFTALHSATGCCVPYLCIPGPKVLWKHKHRAVRGALQPPGPCLQPKQHKIINSADETAAHSGTQLLQQQLEVQQLATSALLVSSWHCQASRALFAL
jgi:hypothetical protein